MITIDLNHYLSPALIPQDHFGRRIGVRSKCLPDLIEAGLFPRPLPLTINGRLYFTERMWGAWWVYVESYATDHEVEEIAKILRNHDPRCLDYRQIGPDETTRDWLNDVLAANTDEDYLP